MLRLAILVFAFALCNAANYCSLPSCNGQPHTMCVFAAGPSSRCTGTTKVGLTPQEQVTLVQLHNHYRQLVASGQETRGNPGPQFPAAFMPNLTWDNELAEVAQRWASQCDFNHDSCRNVERFYVGQNIAQRWSTAPEDLNLEGLVTMWYDEVKYFNKNDIAQYKSDPTTGHYTQMVWAETTKVGCGFVKYWDRGMGTTYLVCNYGPGGNVIGQTIYKPAL